MMTEVWQVLAAVAALTLSIRLGGILMGQRLPRRGPWARGLRALPGCLIVALVCVLLSGGGPPEWLAGAIAAVAAFLSRNLLVTMLVGVAAVSFLRAF